MDIALCVIIVRRSVRNGFKTLMRAKVVVIVNIFFDDSVELGIVENDEVIKAFGADRADESFSISVQVWRVRNSRNTCDIVLVIGKVLELTGIIRTASVLCKEDDHTRLLTQSANHELNEKQGIHTQNGRVEF